MRRPFGWALLLFATYAVGCTTMLGVDGDYSLFPEEAGVGGTAGEGGTSTGGTGGTSPGGTGGTSTGGTGGTSTGGTGGTSTGGTGGTSTGGTGGAAGAAGQATGGTGGAGGAAGQATGGTGGTSTGGTGGTSTGGTGGTTISPLTAMRAGSTAISADTDSKSVPIASVDPENSFLVFNYRYDFGNPPVSQVSGQLSAANTLTFLRTTGPSGVEIPIQYYVASFESGVSVQRGSTPMTNVSTAVPLGAAVSLDSSFPIVSMRTGGNYYGPWNFVRATLTNAQTLTLDATGTDPNTIVEWQVVSFEGAKVQSGQASLASADTAKKATMASVDPNTTWLMFTYTLGNISGGGMADRLIRGRINSGTEVEFLREGSGAVAEIQWYAVTFENGSRVTSGESTMTGSEASVQAPIGPAVDPLRSLASTVGFYGRGGSTNYSLSNTAITVFTLDVGAGDSLLLRRIRTGGGSVVANVTWSAVEFQ